jgi:hypothetical protein
MKVAETVPRPSVVDVLDRVLDKGVVIDAWVRVSLVGIDLIDVKARVVVASIPTYVRWSEAVNQAALAAPPGEGTAAVPPATPPAPPAPPTAPSRPPRARRRRGARRVEAAQCAQGCTFTGAARVIRCPYDRRRRCTLRATSC